MSATILPFPGAKQRCHDCGWEMPTMTVTVKAPTVIVNWLDTLDAAVYVCAKVTCPCGATTFDGGEEKFDCLDVEVRRP